jgi:hypothetical protein
VEEFAKKIKTTEEIEAYVTRLKQIEATPEEFKAEVDLIVSETTTTQQQLQSKRQED